MKKQKWLVLLITIIFAASVILAGCGAKKETTSEATGEIDKEQYLNFSQSGDAATLDAGKAGDGYTDSIINDTTERLVRLISKDGKDAFEPGDAESWKISDDNLVWTFKLRASKWSDGKPVTANDYVYGFTRLLSKDGPADNYMFFDIKNGKKYFEGNAKQEELGVKAVDDKTFQITLSKPVPYFLSILSMPIASPHRKDVIESVGKDYGQDPKKMVFNGPFVIDEWAHGTKVVLKKNDKYWDEKKVKLGKVVFNIIKEETPSKTMLKDGQLDAGEATGKWGKELLATGKIKLQEATKAALTRDIFNSKTPILKSPKVRLALSLAKDREDLNKTIYEGEFTPAYGWIPLGLSVQEKIDFRKETKEPLLTEKEKNKDIKALFKEGLKESGLDPEKTYTLKVLIEGNTSARTLGEWYKAQIESKLPIKVELDAVNDNVQFSQRRKSLDFEVMCERLTGAYINDPIEFLEAFSSTSDQNNGQYLNKEFDTLIEQSKKEVDAKKRYELFKQAEEILLVKDPAIAPGVYYNKNAYVHNYVKNFMLPTFSPGYEIKYAYTSGRK